ncbi:hypothetical protein OY671_009146, partial [Metschnikowia pulcherrima]
QAPACRAASRAARQPRAGFRRTYSHRGKSAQHAARSPGQSCQPLPAGVGQRQSGGAGAAPGCAPLPPRPQLHRRSIRIRVVAQLPERPSAQRGFRAQVRADRAGGLCSADRYRPAAPPRSAPPAAWEHLHVRGKQRPFHRTRGVVLPQHDQARQNRDHRQQAHGDAARSEPCLFAWRGRSRARHRGRS